MFVQLTALKTNPAGIYLFKVHNRNIKILCETCLKLKRETPGQRHQCCSIVFLLLTSNIFETSKCRLEVGLKMAFAKYSLK